MSQQELLSTIAWALDSREIPYLVSGSLASCLHGGFRPPRGIDLVVDLRAGQADALLDAFPPPEFFLAEDDVREAISGKELFNVMSLVDCTRVDFWPHSGSDFDLSRFARRNQAALGGVEISFPTAEDALLALLDWNRRHPAKTEALADAQEIYSVQRDLLDAGYLAHWAKALGVEEALLTLQRAT